MTSPPRTPPVQRAPNKNSQLPCPSSDAGSAHLLLDLTLEGGDLHFHVLQLVVWERVHVGAGLRLLGGRKHEVGQRDVPFAVILLVLPANKPEGDRSQEELGLLSLNPKTTEKGLLRTRHRPKQSIVPEEPSQETPPWSRGRLLGSGSGEALPVAGPVRAV